MSLINDALKKAQHARSSAIAAPPMVGRNLDRTSETKTVPVLKFALVGLVLVTVLSGAISFLVVGLFNSDRIPSEPSGQVGAALSPPPAAATVPPAPSTSAAVIPRPQQPPSAVTVAAPTAHLAAPIQPPIPPSATPAPAVAPPIDAPRVARAPTADPGPASALPPAAPTSRSAGSTATSYIYAPPIPPVATHRGMADPRIVAYVDTLEIQGTRLSPSNRKVLMNNKVYRTGSVVSKEYRLRILEIKQNTIVFVDHAGIKYFNHF